MSKLRYKENKFTLTVKIIMTVIYMWSCFFWSGVTILNFYINMPEYSYLATGFLIGSCLMTLSMVLTYLRFYIFQLPLCIAGSVVFLRYAGEMIDTAAHSEVVFKPSFELRYMPVVAILIFSFALAVVHVWSLVEAHIAKKEEYNNRPSKSIFD